MIAVLLAAASPVPAAVVFAPPNGARFRYVVERTTSDTPARRFRVERDVRFTRDAAGVVADITLERTEQAPDDGVADRFARANAPLVGRALRFHFARDGAVVAVDGGEAVFEALIGSIGALAKGAAAPLAALPPERRLAMVAGIATPFVAGADAAAAPGTRAVTLASALPGGAAVSLSGTRAVSRDAAGNIVIVVHAEGGGVVLDRTRIVDPAAGLVIEQRETVTVTTAGVARTSRSTMTLWPVVS